MRFYLCDDINIESAIDKLKQYKINESKENILLTHFGLMKYINNNLYIFKCDTKYDDNDDNDGNDYNDDYSINDIDTIERICKKKLVKTSDPWKQINDIKYQIPFDSYILKLKKITFALNKNYNVSFIIEIYDTIKVDYYFEVNKVKDDIFYKNDICSFLKIIN